MCELGLRVEHSLMGIMARRRELDFLARKVSPPTALRIPANERGLPSLQSI